jgi:hypothetical protein
VESVLLWRHGRGPAAARVTPDVVKSRLAGDPTFDAWDEVKQTWFCDRVVDIHARVEGMKDPSYRVPLAQLKSSLRKTLKTLKPVTGEVADYLAGGLPFPNLSRGYEQVRTLEELANRILAMPKPPLVELTTALDEDNDGPSAGDDPGSRRKWRNDVATQMVHQLLKDAGVEIARTGESIYSEGSPSMKLMARVFDCLDGRKRRRKTDTVVKRLVRTRGKTPPKK